MSTFTGGPLTEEEEYLLDRFKILREKVFYCPIFRADGGFLSITFLFNCEHFCRVVSFFLKGKFDKAIVIRSPS